MAEVFPLEGKRVWVAGSSGMVGSAVVRRLASEPIGELITASHAQLDMCRQADVERFVQDTRPDVLILAAAKVGGIQANRTAQADFLYDNLLISANGIEAARRHGVEKVLVLGSSCIYPRDAPQPIKEEHLLTGPLEPTNEGYAIAKIAALEMGKMYQRQHGYDVISLMPTNLYGPNDNFDLETAHVLPALMRKIHEAKERGDVTVNVWGTGRPRREFVHVDDAADAVIFCLRNVTGVSHLNLGCGEDVSISELCRLIADVVGWEGEFQWDTSMPDGMFRKLLDVSKLAELGWRATTDLSKGLTMTYQWFLDHHESLRGL
jgi:GDP-L-fucose synthase